MSLADDRPDAVLGLTRSLTFMPAMVDALIHRNKTVTRRVFHFDPRRQAPAQWDGRFRNDDEAAPERHLTLRGVGLRRYLPVPIWAGDRVLIKERFEVVKPRDPKSGMTKIRYGLTWRAPMTWIHTEDLQVLRTPGWKSARFMPNAAARLTLAVGHVRVHRLDDMTDDDAKEEGIFQLGPRWSAGEHGGQELHGKTPRMCFAVLWDVHHGGKKGESWRENPWVLAIRFRVES